MQTPAAVKPTTLTTRQRVGRAVLLAVPGLALGAAGLLHPMHLSFATSRTWWMLHLVGLFIFPLVGLALATLARGRRDPLVLLGVLAAYIYATAYGALDVINGLAAGYVTWRLGEGVPRPDEVRYLFAIGSPLGQVGSIALLVAVALLLLDGVRRSGARALPALVGLLGAWGVHQDHIFSPIGAAGMALVALSTAWLYWVQPST
ncbi:MAG: hypothetical protein ABIN79_09775 [Marmoricola sp.]